MWPWAAGWRPVLDIIQELFIPLQLVSSWVCMCYRLAKNDTMCHAAGLFWL